MAKRRSVERLRIHRRGLKLARRDSPQDKFDFMQQCVSALTNDGAASDDDQAEMICDMLWEEQDIDLGDFGD